MVVLSIQGCHLKTPAAPHGIISFELAGRRAAADLIVASWSPPQPDVRGDAFLNLGVDYLFLFLYPLTISLACHLTARRGQRFGCRTWIVGAILSWLVLVATPLDATENYALIKVLKSSSGDFWSAMAKWCAILKFGLILIGTGYVVVWLVLELVTKKGAAR
ncbi:MAG TPA: hypothetical protein VHE60_11150 [Pyrinomonadaceae bacterium]|nr:hypothetical protein [Pyrinomonadaceae bacterium]